MQKSFIIRAVGVALMVGGLSACAQQGYGGYGTTAIPADAQRAAGGALAGAVVAKAVDGNVATGALIGAAGGALCDEVGVCAQ